MPQRFAIAAALATVLMVAGCGAAEPTADPGSQPSSAVAEQAQQAPDGTQPEPEAAAEADEGDAPEPVDTGASGTSESAQDSALRADTRFGRTDPGEPGLPAQSGASVDDVLRLGAVATWVDAPDVLAISLPATDHCWPSATAPVVVSPTQLSVAFVPDKQCEGFETARTYTVAVPDGIDEGAPLEIVIEGLQHHFTLTLPEQ